MAERKAVTIYVGDAKSLVAASAEAKAALKSVQDQASKKSGLDALPQLGGKITSSLIAVTPVLTGLTGALGGLAASATAAAGGAGAVGAGGLGALVVGLGSIAAVVKPAMTQLKSVTTALDAYNLQLANHATTAKQAAAAQSKLNAVVSQNGGADVLKAAKSWDALGVSFAKLTKPATATLFKAFNDGLGTMKDLLPTVAGIANKSMSALADALQKPLKMLGGSEFQGILKSLGDVFAKSIGPAVDAVSLAFLGFSRIAQAAGPYVVQLAKGLENIAQGFANATKDPTKLGTIISGLVSNTEAWLKLTGAVGRLIFDVFKQGVGAGKGMVTSLTQVVDKWDAWVNSAKGSQAVQNFFRESAAFARELFSALGPILQAVSVMSTGALPVYVSLLSKFKNVLGPLTYGLVAYKVALTAANAATKIAEGFSGKKLFGGAVAAGPSIGAAIPVAARGATVPPAAIEKTVMGSLKSGLSTTLSRGVSGLMVGTIGAGLSQAIGSAIHGAAGQAVKTIGTDTSIGAGFGSIFGPLGMAGGALIGGVVGSISNFISNHAAQQGKEWAQKFTVDLPNQIGKKTADAVAQTATKVRATAKPGSTLANIQSGANPYSSILGHAPVGHPSANPYASILNPGGTAGTDPKMLAQQTAALTKAYFAEGQAAGKAVVAGMKSVKDPSQGILLSDFTMQLQKLPAEAKPQAAKVMLNFATGLQQGGKISLKALEDIVRGIEGQIPGLASYMQYEGQVTAKQLIETMKFTQATSTLKNTLAGYRKQFGDMAISTSITGQNIDQNITTAMSHLHTIVATTTGKTRTDAVNTLQRMHDQVTSLFDTMGGKVQASIKSMGIAVKDGTSAAAKAAYSNLGDFASNVGQAMQNGVVSVGQGMKLIIDNTNKALKEMGQKQLSPIQVSSLTLGTAKQRQLAGHAGGGLVQFGKAGDRGRDTIPVNFGGAHIAVGSGEVGMVANNQQQAFLNARTADVGGLPGVFQKFSKKHYMASGGIVTASEYGGPSDHTVSQTDPRGYKGDNLLQHPDSYAELNMGTALGGLPYMAPLNVTYHGKTARLFKRDIGAGGPGLGGHTRAIDLWFQAANALGFNGLGNVTVGGAGGASVSVGGALGDISAPGIKGSGAMATIANAAMKILTKGANAYIGSKTPASTGGGGSFSFQNFSGKLPAAAQKAMQVAQYIVGRHVPYGTGEFGAYYGMGGNAPSYDCSGFVSTVLNLAGLDPAGHLLTGGLKQWGEPGPGKYITVGVLGADSGPTGHTMMEIANKYFESGGGGGGPHQDSGWSSVFPIMRHPAGLAKGGIVRGGKDKIFPGHAGHQPTLAEFLSDRRSGLTMAGGGVLPFVGSYKSGGVIPQTGMALVHKNETVLPAFASGGIPNAAGMTAPFLYPLDAAIAALAAKIAALQSAALPNHNKDIAALTAELVKIRRERINPPAAHNAGQITTLQSQLTGMRKDGRNLPTPASGKAGDTQRAANAQKRKDLSQQELDIETKIAALKKADTASVAQRRKDLENQTLTIEQKIKTLKGDDKATVNQNAALVVGITLQSKNLQQLNNYKQAIAALSTQMVGMAEQAAQAWNAAQQKQITATHDAAIAAIQGGADATTLAAMQAQDTADANAAQLAALQATLATDQTTANNSGGQTHVDALAQVKADQAAIDAFQRQQTEDQLQANIDAATTKADDAQQAALDGLDQQTADYQASLDAQLAALTASLDQRKLNYAQWAADVDAILQPYGLSASTDPTTEGTVSTGPGPGGGPVTVTTKTAKTVVPPKPKKGKSSGAFTFGGARAMGGGVQPGYVYRVGEQGPEDVVFGQSGTVHTAAQTRSGGLGGGVHIHGNLVMNGARSASALADRLAYRAAIGTA